MRRRNGEHVSAICRTCHLWGALHPTAPETRLHGRWLVDESGKPLKGKAQGKKGGANKACVVEIAPVKPLVDGLEQEKMF